MAARMINRRFCALVAVSTYDLSMYQVYTDTKQAIQWKEQKTREEKKMNGAQIRFELIAAGTVRILSHPFNIASPLIY